MGLKKGTTNNPEGRPKGKPNRTTEELKQVFIDFLDKNIDRLQTDFNSLEPKDRLLFIEKISKLVLPPPLQELKHTGSLNDEDRQVHIYMDGEEIKLK